MKMTCLVLLVAVCICGVSASDSDSRDKRSVDVEAQLPVPESPDKGGYPAADVQAPFIMGQCVMCPPGAPGPRGPPGPPCRFQIMDENNETYTYATPELEEPEPVQPRIPIYTFPRPVLPKPAPPKAGVVYTRWGKPECPDSSELVYHGIMASSHSHTHKGSGSNYLCMPPEPTFNAEDPDYNGGAYMYGVEFNNDLYTSRAITNSEASCAVCLAGAKSTVLMIPGTNVCPEAQDWTLEYQGYIMASYYTHFKSEFVCVDDHAEGIPRTAHNNDEATLYVADAQCSASGGGLPCPPYASGYDVLCAVCTL